MQENDILKYSQQLTAHFPDRKPLDFNGFFVRCMGYTYFVTVNHGVAPDMEMADSVHLVLHTNSIGINTFAVRIKNWQFIDFYEFLNNKGYTLPRLIDTDRLDIAFCGVQKDEFENSIEQLPIILEDVDGANCHKKELDCITLTQNSISPTSAKQYFVAGKIFHKINAARAKYDILYISGMEYVGDDEGLHEFKIMQSIDDCEGLSGSPVFDNDKNLVGMVLRYRKEDNVLRVLPANEIAYYLYNDFTPSPEEIEYYNQK